MSREIVNLGLTAKNQDEAPYSYERFHEFTYGGALASCLPLDVLYVDSQTFSGEEHLPMRMLGKGMVIIGLIEE